MLLFSLSDGLGPDDRDFVEQLYRDYSRLMFSKAMNIIHDPMETEDLVQEGFLSAMMKLDILRQLRPPQRIAYLCKTVEHLAIQRAYSRRRTAELDESDPAWQDENADPTQIVEEAMLLHGKKAILKQVWPKLNKTEQYLLDGKYILDKADDQLAKELDIQPSSIRMKLTRARRHAYVLMIKGGSGQ